MILSYSLKNNFQDITIVYVTLFREVCIIAYRISRGMLKNKYYDDYGTESLLLCRFVQNEILRRMPM